MVCVCALLCACVCVCACMSACGHQIISHHTHKHRQLKVTFMLTNKDSLSFYTVFLQIFLLPPPLSLSLSLSLPLSLSLSPSPPLSPPPLSPSLPPSLSPSLTPPPPSFSLPLAIAEAPEIREYILQLKVEFGQAADRVAEEAEAEKSEELGPRTRRLSVRRMRQADKNNMMKGSIKEEAMMRRESMVQQVCKCLENYCSYSHGKC